MAKHLDLEEQEQLDQLKHFWKQYGNLITWALIVVFGSIAAWNGWQYWQRNQAAQAAAMYDEVDRSAKAGDPAQLERALADMKDKFASTAYAPQAALLAAKTFYAKGKTEEAKAALIWVASNASDEGYKAIARLRLAGLFMDAKAYDEALKQLADPVPTEFDALVADRRGDIYLLQGKRAEAREAFTRAYKGFEDRSEYRRLVEIKLNSMGVDPQPLSGTAGETGAKP
ncbi:MAG: tetratricopeptide repeat protein [Ramlibacter sp.]|nr:tetratricopeptide repeat protein [Ramlibacter sp.]MCW5650681.1 tetratricopeptide repeat protein [Ramlibacter sp.]